MTKTDNTLNSSRKLNPLWQQSTTDFCSCCELFKLVWRTVFRSLQNYMVCFYGLKNKKAWAFLSAPQHFIERTELTVWVQSGLYSHCLYFLKTSGGMFPRLWVSRVPLCFISQFWLQKQLCVFSDLVRLQWFGQFCRRKYVTRIETYQNKWWMNTD